MVALPKTQVQPPPEEPAEESTPQNQAPKFAGYKKGKGYTEFNHAIFDEMLSQIDNLAELKVVMYVHRHTIGWNQEEVALSVAEFVTGRERANGEPMDRGTALAERSVQYGIKRALENGRIERRQEGNKVYFRLRMAEQSDQKEASDQDGEQAKPGAQSLHPSTDPKQAQSLHPKGAKSAPRTGNGCTPGAQNLHRRTRLNPHQSGQGGPPKEITERNSTEKEKESSLSLSQKTSFSSSIPQGARYQRSGDIRNPQQEEIPRTAKDAQAPVTDEQSKKLQERLAALKRASEQRIAAEKQRVRVPA